MELHLPVQESTLQLRTSGTGTNPGTNGNGAPSVQCGGGGGGFYTSGGNDLTYSYYGGIRFPAGCRRDRSHSPGGSPPQYYQNGGTGGGAEADYYGNCNVGAGAGGGYSGGSGVNGATTVATGQGGGSFNGGVNQTNTAGNNTGNGQVIISWVVAGCSSTRVPVTITVDSVSVIPASFTQLLIVPMVLILCSKPEVNLVILLTGTGTLFHVVELMLSQVLLQLSLLPPILGIG